VCGDSTPRTGCLRAGGTLGIGACLAQSYYWTPYRWWGKGWGVCGSACVLRRLLSEDSSAADQCRNSSGREKEKDRAIEQVGERMERGGERGNGRALTERVLYTY